MIGVILAAGMAKRLRPLTDERPKCLLKVGERTLLQRTVDAMLDAGIRELVVVTGYRANMIRDTSSTIPTTPTTITSSPSGSHAPILTDANSCSWTATSSAILPSCQPF